MYSTTDRTPRKPSWAKLYLLAALLMGAVGLVETLIAPGAWRRTLEIVVCVAGFGAIHVWVRAQGCALDLLGQREGAVSEVLVEPPLRRGRDTGEAAPRRDRANVLPMQGNRRGTPVAVPERNAHGIDVSPAAPEDGRVEHGRRD